MRFPSKVLAESRCWWSQPGSNRRPPACKAGDLPTELWPRRFRGGNSKLVGLGGLEPPTPRLSSVCSNQLSYRPKSYLYSVSLFLSPSNQCGHLHLNVFLSGYVIRIQQLSKEVIQPQVPLRLPCYDFTPVMNHTVVTVLPRVRLATSGATHSHGVTGGVYKARERIHRDILIRDY